MHPEYASIDFRRASFKKFPRSCPVKPNELCDAGFYYVGSSDCVRCFYCGGGLCNWEAGDLPWPEHRRLYPTCQFMLLNLAEQPSSSESSDEEMTVVAEENNDINAVIEEWLNSDIVTRIKEEKQFSMTVIRNVLHQRYLTVRKPFESFDNLLAAVETASEHPLDPRSEQLMSESDEESAQSSQESVLSTSPSSSSDEERDERASRVTCKVCLDKEIGVLFLPCGHLVACIQCGPGLVTCPLCRSKIVKTHRTFLA